MADLSTLEKYADLVLQKGVNIQKNQALFISAPIEGADFARIVAKKAYELGAKDVHVNWSDDELTLLKYKNASDEVIGSFPKWRVNMQEYYAKDGAAFISIHATDPDLLSTVDGKRIAAANQASGKALTEFRKMMMNDEVTWSVISIPTTAWAKKIFPDQTEPEAVESLWSQIFKMVRVDKANPIAAWEKHNATLKKAHETLNARQYDKLILKAPGTNLEIGLPKGHIWAGGEAESAEGIIFNPNLPTEEVFTAPDKYNVNGTVSSTKPLNYGGNLIDDFTLTFKEGKVVDASAKQGEEALEHMLDADEGARRIGEIALVPHESPVSQTGLIFYNTLFDENASCHIALGKAYPTNIAGGAAMDLDDLDKNGMNDSIIHVDFMVGSEAMDIDGVTADGTIEPLFRKGTWAITFD